jgi:hypothetical protein
MHDILRFEHMVRHMAKYNQPIYFLVGSIAVMSAVNLFWLRSPGSIPLALLVFTNLLGGFFFFYSLFRVALLITQKNVRLGANMPNMTLRAFLSLGLSLLIANAVALYVCDFHLCFLSLLINITVPVAWYLGRQVMVRYVASHKAGSTSQS